HTVPGKKKKLARSKMGQRADLVLCASSDLGFGVAEVNVFVNSKRDKVNFGKWRQITKSLKDMFVQLATDIDLSEEIQHELVLPGFIHGGKQKYTQSFFHDLLFG
ncbi:20149_t:CDS:1, partial [Entrophospora sp. SA101]